MIFCGVRDRSRERRRGERGARRAGARGPLGELPQLPGVERGQQLAGARGGAQRGGGHDLLADEHPGRRLTVGDQAHQSHR